MNTTQITGVCNDQCYLCRTFKSGATHLHKLGIVDEIFRHVLTANHATIKDRSKPNRTLFRYEKNPNRILTNFQTVHSDDHEVF